MLAGRNKNLKTDCLQIKRKSKPNQCNQNYLLLFYCCSWTRTRTRISLSLIIGLTDWEESQWISWKKKPSTSVDHIAFFCGSDDILPTFGIIEQKKTILHSKFQHDANVFVLLIFLRFFVFAYFTNRPNNMFYFFVDLYTCTGHLYYWINFDPIQSKFNE